MFSKFGGKKITSYFQELDEVDDLYRFLIVDNLYANNTLYTVKVPVYLEQLFQQFLPDLSFFTTARCMQKCINIRPIY